MNGEVDGKIGPGRVHSDETARCMGGGSWQPGDDAAPTREKASTRESRVRSPSALSLLCL